MREGNIDAFDLERIIDAVEHEMNIEPLEEPRVAVTDNDSESNEGHIVNVRSLHCSCKDFKYNCQKNEAHKEDSRYCKHIYRVAFEKVGIL